MGGSCEVQRRSQMWARLALDGLLGGDVAGSAIAVVTTRAWADRLGRATSPEVLR